MGDKKSKRRVAGDGRCHGTALHYNLLPRGVLQKIDWLVVFFFCPCGWSSAPQSESPRTRLENALGKVLDNKFGYEEGKKKKMESRQRGIVKQAELPLTPARQNDKMRRKGYLLRIPNTA